jgi:hypothetical protein
VSGAGDIAISAINGVIIITVTASDADYKSEYKIHYQMDTPLTLTHSYTFAMVLLRTRWAMQMVWL